MQFKDIHFIVKGQAKERYEELKEKSDKYSVTIFNSIKKKQEILEINPQHGEPLSKKLIPSQFIQQGIHTLYRIELAHFWRMSYTIVSSNKELYIVILTIFSHKEYDKFFGYD